MDPMIGQPIPARVAIMRERLIGEAKAIELLERVERYDGAEDQLFDVMMAIPCILHLEMRVGIKNVDQCKPSESSR